jgi:hypothetical protein
MAAVTGVIVIVSASVMLKGYGRPRAVSAGDTLSGCLAQYAEADPNCVTRQKQAA